MAADKDIETPAKKRKLQEGSNMDSPSQAGSPAVAESKCYKIGGISVEFPYKAYGCQLAYMGKVIAALENAHRHGHCNALLESPTGTGKSLSLLCASLAWQRHHTARLSQILQQQQHQQQQSQQILLQQQQSQQILQQQRRDQPPPPTPTASQRNAAFSSGGGFVPEPSQHGTSSQETTGGSKEKVKKPKVPTIFYASRTHSQISQVIREYRKTSYRVPMAVLAARKHYCTNRRVCTKKNVDEECKLLLKGSEQTCLHFKNAYKVKYHSSIKKGGCNEVHDIEDLVKVGHMVKGCSYFAARDMALEAQLVFCPYSYILHPVIRRSMEVDITGDIIILDEAHNIEDISREAGSVDVEESILQVLQTELSQLSSIPDTAMIYQPLFEMIQALNQWILEKSNNLEKREFEHYCSCWTGDKALWELQLAGISLNQFPILQECALKAIKAAQDSEKDGFCLTGLSSSILESLFSSFTYFFSDNGRQAYHYQLSVQRYVKRDEGMPGPGWATTFSLWCLNPSVVFKEIAEASLSVILTSGTLSPLNSFASELGVPFEICMEAPHVVNLDTQVWAAAISAGPRGVPLNASYKTADGYEFQDALGISLEEICSVVPNGALVFFPSYKLMEKLCRRWQATGQWDRLHAKKSLFVEPRGSQENFDAVLGDYYGAIHGQKKGKVTKMKSVQKKLMKTGALEEGSSDKKNGGAAFLAVCRGKVSEGIDFSDENARAVIVIGIPFPNTKDIQVSLKKQYNDKYKSLKRLLSGDQWYCFQAFRALNQAIGRCIRHRLDFGAIILMDERFKRPSNLEYMSKWLRNSIKHYENVEHSVLELRKFFSRAEEMKLEAIAASSSSTLKNCHTDICVDISSPDCRGASAELKALKMHEINVDKTIVERDIPNQETDEENDMAEIDDLIKAERTDDGDISKKSVTSTVNSIDIADKNTMQLHQEFSKSPQNTQIFKSCISTNEASPSCNSGHAKFSSPPTSVNKKSLASLNKGAYGLELCEELDCSLPPENGCTNHCIETSNFHDFTPGKVAEESFMSHQNYSNSGIESCHSKSSNSRSLLAYEIKNDLFGKKFTHDLFSEELAEENVRSQGNEIPVTGNDGWVTLSKKWSKSGSTPVSPFTTQQNKSSKKDILDLVPDQIEEGSRTEVQKTMLLPSNCFRESGSKSVEAADKNVTGKLCSVSCTECDFLFGLPEKQFLSSCWDTSLSKSYFNALKRIGTGNVSSVQKTAEKTPVVVSDIQTVCQKLIHKPNHFQCMLDNSNSQYQSTWVEEDGCVYRKLCCPQCKSHNCLGVQVVAADASNISLLDKAIFFKDKVKILERPSPATTPVSKVHGEITDAQKKKVLEVSSLYEYTFTDPNKQKDYSTSKPASKSKMSLPKRL